MRERDDRAIIGMPANRYIPVEVRRVVIEEFGKICSMPGCDKPAENLHHENGFAIDQCHDPRFLKPLCRGHHELAHAGNAFVLMATLCSAMGKIHSNGKTYDPFFLAHQFENLPYFD